MGCFVQPSAHQFTELVIGFEPPQHAAELMVVAVFRQPLLLLENVPCACHQLSKELGALHLCCEQGPPH